MYKDHCNYFLEYNVLKRKNLGVRKYIVPTKAIISGINIIELWLCNIAAGNTFCGALENVKYWSVEFLKKYAIIYLKCVITYM